MIQKLELLADEARTWCEGRDYDLEDPFRFAGSDGSLIRSALQKAIRRGHQQDAARLALALFSRRGTYAMRSLLTISLEDVGFGSPEALLWCTAAKSDWFRERVGQRRLLVAVARELARAPKSRAACDLSFVGDLSFRDHFRAWSQLPYSDLIGHLQNPDPHLAYVSAALLAGTVPRGVQKPRIGDADLQLTADAIADGLSSRLGRAAAATFLCPLDNMSAATAITFKIAQNAPDIEVDCRSPATLGTVRGFRSEALDQHVPLGRSALRHFADELRALSPLSTHGSAAAFARQVGDAVFLEEGQLLRGQVHCPALDELQRAADDLTLERHGLSSLDAQLLRGQVRDALPRLHEIRLQVLSQPKRANR